MKIFNYLQEYKREKPVNQQDKLIQTHYPQTEHSPKSQQKTLKTMAVCKEIMRNMKGM